MAKIEDQICEAIEYIVRDAVDNAGYDKTIQATIVSCIDATIGKYKVKYQDSTFYAYANNSEVTYTNGSDVYILVPGNDMSRDKTILGTTKKLGINYSPTPEGEEAYEPVGSNCIESHNSFELCSYAEGKVVNIIYDRQNSGNNKITLNVNSAERYIRESSSIICGATFRTALPVEQQFRGNYGIVYELVFLDNASEKTVTRNYVLDVNQITGNPYKLINNSRQYGIFEVDGANFQYINRIYLFVYDFPNSRANMPNDIFISNLELNGAKPMSAEELAGCAIAFITPQGAFFDNTNTDREKKQIQAQVRVKGKIIDPNSQLLEYY